MKRIHCLIGIVSFHGEWYAECACGTRTHGGDEDEAFQKHTAHKHHMWATETDD